MKKLPSTDSWMTWVSSLRTKDLAVSRSELPWEPPEPLALPNLGNTQPDWGWKPDRWVQWSSSSKKSLLASPTLRAPEVQVQYNRLHALIFVNKTCLLPMSGFHLGQFNSIQVGKLWIHAHTSSQSCKSFKNVMAPARLLTLSPCEDAHLSRKGHAE